MWARLWSNHLLRLVMIQEGGSMAWRLSTSLESPRLCYCLRQQDQEVWGPLLQGRGKTWSSKRCREDIKWTEQLTMRTPSAMSVFMSPGVGRVTVWQLVISLTCGSCFVGKNALFKHQLRSVPMLTLPGPFLAAPPITAPLPLRFDKPLHLSLVLPLAHHNHFAKPWWGPSSCGTSHLWHVPRHNQALLPEIAAYPVVYFSLPAVCKGSQNAVAKQNEWHQSMKLNISILSPCSGCCLLHQQFRKKSIL